MNVLPAATVLLLAGATAAQQVATPRTMEIHVPGRASVARLWSQPGPDGQAVPHYSLSLDGVTFTPAKATSYDLMLRYQRHDPLVRRPEVAPELRADGASRLHIVQYWTQGIEDYREAVRGLGGEIHLFLANHANVVEMDQGTARAVSELPFVRSVSPYHPAYKLEPALLDAVRERRSGEVKVNLLAMRRGGQEPVAAFVRESGGTVEHVSRETYLMTATLRYEQLSALVARDDVQFVDRWMAPENDMNIARNFHGANHVENSTGYVGNGVNVEVMDDGMAQNHPDMQNFILHSPVVPAGSHGTCTSGIIVGTGAGNANARGALPGALLSMAYYSSYAGGSRYAHSAQLVDAGLPYQCVLQSNSWGNGRTLAYTTVSQDMDTILFDLQNLSILNSQSNANNQQSRPQAWAKNIISVGGINHRNTQTKADDAWGGASIGPAADGRVKPDLASFYDNIQCVDRLGTAGYAGGAYTTGFGGTSGATPIVAGTLGLVYEMWSEGIFGNPISGTTVFENAPKNTTAKALLINTASQWNFSGETHNLGRFHQGWGHPQLNRLYDWRNNLMVVDETDVLTELQSSSYPVDVDGSFAKLRVTLVFRDPAGTTSSTLHRINDLDLMVASPSGTIYHGNRGLQTERNSASGGTPNTRDTVENVFVDTPEIGTWTVTVTASELNQDSHVETPALDADYALVVSGIASTVAPPPAAPGDLRGSAGRRNILLTWNDLSADEDGFTIEVSTDGVNFDVAGTTGPNVRQFRDRGLTTNTTYYHRVSAFNAGGSSGYSNVSEIRTKNLSIGGGTGQPPPPFF